MAILKTILLLICTNLVFAQQGKLTLWQGVRGLNNTQLSQNIADNQFQDMQNVFTDKDNNVQVCGGTDKVWQSTGSVRFMKEFVKSDGNRYLVFVASRAVNYTKTAGSYTTIYSTLSTNSIIWGVSLLDKFYFGEHNGDRWYFDGTNVIQSTEVPKFKWAISAYGKIYGVNIDATGQRSRVQYCKIGDANNFPDNYYIDVNAHDGEEATGIFLSRDGNIYITKPHSLHKLINVEDDDNTNDNWITITNEIGCVSGNTIQEMNNEWYWASEDGIVKFNGGNFELISQYIDGSVDNISELTSSTQYDVDTSSMDFGNGTQLLNVSTIVVNGSITADYTTNAQLNQQAISGTNAGLELTTVNNYQTFTSSLTGILTKIDTYINMSPSGIIPTTNWRLFDGDLTSTITVSVPCGQQSGTAQPVSINFNTFISSGVTYKFGPAQAYPTIYWSEVTRNAYDNARGSATINGTTISSRDWHFQMYIFSSSHVYISEKKNAQSETNTWKMWEKIGAIGSSVEGATISVRASGTSDGLETSGWTSVQNNGLINLSTGTWIQYKVEMTTSARIEDVTISYFVTGSPDTLSSYVDIPNIRYWLGCTVLPSVIPDTQLVYQNLNQSWTKIKAHNVASMTKYKYNQYLGDYNGGIYIYSDDYTDFDGTSKAPYIQTKDFDLGSRINDKIFRELWLSYEPSTTYSNSTVSYHIDKSATAYASPSLSLTAYTSYPLRAITHKLRSSLENRGFRYINFKVSNFDQLNGLEFFYDAKDRD